MSPNPPIHPTLSKSLELDILELALFRSLRHWKGCWEAQFVTADLSVCGVKKVTSSLVVVVIIISPNATPRCIFNPSHLPNPSPSYLWKLIHLLHAAFIKGWISILDPAPGTGDESIQETLKDLLEGYVAVTDQPACMFTGELVAAFPDAVVICTTRDPEKWWPSMNYVAGAIYKWHVDVLFLVLPKLRYFGKCKKALKTRSVMFLSHLQLFALLSVFLPLLLKNSVSSHLTIY